VTTTVVTLDFHNTLIACDAWFELEIRTLVSRTLDWAEERQGIDTRAVDRESVTREYRRLRKAIHEHGHELDAEKSVTLVLERLGFSLPGEIVQQALHDLMTDALASASPVPGAQQLVSTLEADQVNMGIVSSAVYHPFLEWALERFGMRAAIDTVVTSASVGYYKSRPEIYWAAIDAIGGSPEHSAHVGDSLRFDVGGAKMAGMGGVWYAPNGQAIEDRSLIEPDLIVRELGDAAPDVVAVAREHHPRLGSGLRRGRQ
jgi:FMN phosphatase YigB (HAD superfamily)